MHSPVREVVMVTELSVTKPQLTATVIGAALLLGMYGLIFGDHTDYLMGFGASVGATLVALVQRLDIDESESAGGEPVE